MKKIISFFCTFVLLTSCGTTGHIRFYNFDRPKREVKEDLLKAINTDSAYSVPQKWKESTVGDLFEMYYVYFHSGPEEMYQIGFTGDSTQWKASSTCKLALIGIYDGDTWKFEKDLSRKEEKRIQNRFETNILSKLNYKFSISN